jgi:phage-related protein
MQPGPILDVVFYRTVSGAEPVRDWLKALDREDKRRIGVDLKTVQYGCPLGMPLVRKLEPGLWEIRSQLHQRTARILFTVNGQRMILLHGFIKKSQRTPTADLDLALRRRRDLDNLITELRNNP